MAELLTQSTDTTLGGGAAKTAGDDLRISVIVPVGPGDGAWTSLMPCFANLQTSMEICFVGAEPAPAELDTLLKHQEVKCRTRWIVSKPGRAHQMNDGAAQSTGEYLWFLHADSQFAKSAFAKLFTSLSDHPDSLHYFDLKFARDEFSWLLLNEWGARVRSRVLGLPFGDQGLCIQRRLFAELGAFDETIEYGEDHLLVWDCHCRRVAVRPVGAQLLTSPRKYHDQGWLRTTCIHGWRTWRQALPQLWRLVRSRPR